MEGSVGLREAFESCQRLTRASRTNFYYPFLLLPARRREALISVYAFCRATDDLADEPDGTGSRAERIAAWREELARTYEGRPGQSITRSLRSAILRFRLPKAHFDDLISGVEMDTIQNRYPTFQGLYPYCYRVASTVGLICIEMMLCGSISPAVSSDSISWSEPQNGHTVVFCVGGCRLLALHCWQ